MLLPTRSHRSRTGRGSADTSAPSCTTCSGGSGICLPRSRRNRAWSPGWYRACRRRESCAEQRPCRSLPLQNDSAAAMPCAERAARAMRDRKIAVLHLQFRMRLAAQLTHRLDDLGDAAAVRRVVAAQSAAIGVEGQLADAGDQVAVGDELAALAFLAEAEVFELHQHGDGEAVVDRGVLDVGRLDARHLPGRRTGPACGGVDEVNVAAHLVL